MSEAPVVVGLGEILWDVFPDGPRFGGAPANFACHAAQLGADVRMASAVGQDELGENALKALTEKHVDTAAVQQLEFLTGKVIVELDAAGKASYEFAANSAWDHLECTPAWSDLAARTNAVCFGTLGQRSEASRKAIQAFVQSMDESKTLRIYDINLRPPFYSNDVILESLEIANVLKLNDDELPILAEACGVSGSDDEVISQVMSRFGLQLVAVTRGEQGAELHQTDRVSRFQGVPTKVVDTVGAGDSFTATMAVGLLNGEDLDAINERACQVAAFVCSQSGATPKIPAELR